MPNPNETQDNGKEAFVTYQLKAPTQRIWNPKTGKHEVQPPYNGVVWGVRITDGSGMTTNRSIAIEFADMGYQVKPWPKEGMPEVSESELNLIS